MNLIKILKIILLLIIFNRNIILRFMSQTLKKLYYKSYTKLQPLLFNILIYNYFI